MSEPSLWLCTARELGSHLCDAAIVHDGRCTWLGAMQDEDEYGDLSQTYGTVGPDLYGGAAGIALFLAELAARTNDVVYAERAEQGMRQALRGAAALAGGERGGYFTGVLGVAYAAARVARAIDKPAFAEAASSLLSDSSDEDDLANDIIRGAAGSIPALLTLSDWYSRPALGARALALGDRLLLSARRHDDGSFSWSEEADADAGGLALTGFSHGAAGVGWALRALHAATGEPRFHDAAERAFQYERQLFRPAEDNWPDFRGTESIDDPADCAVAWCHGAPGIALSRFAGSGAPTLGDRLDVEAAVRAATQFVAQTADDPYADWSLCHGLSGICECLLGAAATFRIDAARTVALDVARAAADRFAASPGEWHCGVARGSNPSLMLGLAGIGYLFLRLEAPALATPLLPGARTAFLVADRTK